jgi:hypothetical protein
MKGQEEGDDQHCLMGMYELVEGKVVHGRGVWQLGDRYLFYIKTVGRWYVSDKAGMEASEEAGWINVVSSALTPDRITEMWQVGDGQGWHDAPKMKAQLMSTGVN